MGIWRWVCWNGITCCWAGIWGCGACWTWRSRPPEVMNEKYGK
jgi:hypothetical protein